MQGVGVDQAQPSQPGVLPQREELWTMASQPRLRVARAVGLGLTGEALVRDDAAHRLNDQRLVSPRRYPLLRPHRQARLDHPVVIVGGGEGDPEPGSHLVELAGDTRNEPPGLKLAVLSAASAQGLGPSLYLGADQVPHLL